MKNLAATQSSSAPRRAASPQFILTGLLAATATFALVTASQAQTSSQPFTLDGQFTGGLSGGLVQGEWSDVTPFAFISTPGFSAVPTSLANPLKNTLLYAAISHNTASLAGELQLHLMYDFLPRTTAPTPGELMADVAFPVTLPGQRTGERTNIDVFFTFNPATPGGFDITVDTNGDGVADANDFSAAALQLKGEAGSGPSTLSNTPHLLVELEVPLRIPVGFGSGGAGGLPGGGINPATGLYDPDPVFWGASGAAGGGGSNGPAPQLQSASSAIIKINPDGSLTVTPAPEPASAVLLLGGLAVLGARRRK